MPNLSVVIPVFNERTEDLQTTLAALAAGLDASPWSGSEVLVVDDGSEPPLAVPAAGGLDVRLLRQPNRGRFEARRAGIDAAKGEYVLLLDSRVTLDPPGLAWVAEQVDGGLAAWNGHCMMANPDSPFARFWNVLTHAAFADYLDNPRTTSFTLAEYDRYPKGTGHFLAPRQWLREAVADFDSHYADSRHSSDDTHMLRAIAERDRIHISPQFASVYRNREALRPFLRHAVHRGTTFYDGFGRPGTRFFPVVVAALPGTILAVMMSVRRPLLGLLGVGAAASGGGMFALHRRRPAREVAAFAGLVTPFAIAFGAGLWRGAWLAVRGRVHT